MRAVSFVYTSAPLVSGAKTVTRREWQPRYARSFRAGELVAAYDRRPERGGERLAVIRLVAAPTWEPMSAMPDSDWEAEGHRWLVEHPACIPRTIDGVPAGPEDFSFAAFRAWQSRDSSMWVIRFETLEVLVPEYVERLLARRLDRAAREKGARR